MHEEDVASWYLLTHRAGQSRKYDLGLDCDARTGSGFTEGFCTKGLGWV